MNYARLYDSTIAADYCRAMQRIESQIALEETASEVVSPASLLLLVDHLAAQIAGNDLTETLDALREGIQAFILQARPFNMQDVKDLT